MFNSLKDLMSYKLALDKDYIEYLVNKADSLYKIYTIPKKNGKNRIIYQANKELKTLQYWISNNILNILPISNNALAYKKGTSIKKNAITHISSKHVFHTDISNFFPSINDNKLIEVLKNNEEVLKNNGLLYYDTYETITKICFRKNRLCIGTVSSPIISNIVMYDFDSRINMFCEENEYIYTRYADDIYISSLSHINSDIYEFIKEELNKFGFKINAKKTSFNVNNIRITGINIVNNKRLSIGSRNKRKLKKNIYNFIKYKKGESQVLLGYLAYLKDVEPKSFDKICAKYIRYVKSDLISYLKNDGRF